MTGKCAHCGNDFDGLVSNKRYCSRKCFEVDYCKRVRLPRRVLAIELRIQSLYKERSRLILEIANG